MSYSASISFESDGSVKETVPENLTDSSVEQLNKAKDLVYDLVVSGVLGFGKHVATISGHANNEHKITPGWSNDCVNISVSLVSE